MDKKGIFRDALLNFFRRGKIIIREDDPAQFGRLLEGHGMAAHFEEDGPDVLPRTSEGGGTGRWDRPVVFAPDHADWCRETSDDSGEPPPARPDVLDGRDEGVQVPRPAQKL